MQIQRYIKKEIIDQIRTTKKAIIVYGPRQSGKTTLCEEVIADLGMKTLSINADEASSLEALSSRDARQLHALVDGYELFFLDEAQRIPNIGINLKILIDTFPHVRLLVTGSSSFELANKIVEPLTGRTWSHHLYPISTLELLSVANRYELAHSIEERLLWGSYPEMFTIKPHRRQDFIAKLAQHTLYKDILVLADIRNDETLRLLVKLLALQIGNEVSLSELAQQLAVSTKTVARYIDLLTKVFVLYPLTGFSRNFRKEVSKMHKYYFYDCGIRNGVLNDFRPLSDRSDTGQLWENFLVMERVKRNAYLHHYNTPYFWRTYTGAEIDYVEEGSGMLDGYEFKWGDKKARAPKTWTQTYDNARWSLINRENWIDFVTGEDATRDLHRKE